MAEINPLNLKAQEPTHVLYIDDSGTKEYGIDPSIYRAGGNTRYFVFGGVFVSIADASRLVDRIRTEKERTFGTKAVEIKSNWLRIPWERERRYLQPFGITEADLTSFVDAFYTVIAETNLTLIAAVVDKPQVQRKYAIPWYAPAIAYEMLLQRAVQEVPRGGALAVTVDDMSGATPRGSQYKKNIARHHQQMRRSGSRLQPGIDFSPLTGDVRFLNSALSDQIQAADVVSYNVYRQFVNHGDAWELTDHEGNPQPIQSGITLPTYPYFLKLGSRFRCGPDQRVQGYGIVKFPLVRRIPWRYNADD